jgi:hypothetical protein
MRLAITSCLALLASVAGAAAQTTTTAGTPQPSLQAGSPAYNINSFADLVRICSTDRKDATFPGSVGLCAGYISGVLDYHLVDTGWSGGRRNRRVCLPAEPPTRMQALQSLVSWDQSNQQYDNEPAAEGVMRYFMATYPCHGPRSAARTSRPPG